MSDRTPFHVHATEFVALPCDQVRRQLHTGSQALAERATAAAIEAASASLRAGRFSYRAAPVVLAGPSGEDELGEVTIRWNSDEERTGWPAITLQVSASATTDGTQLAVLSSRPPGYDLSSGRVDRRHRDEVARTAVAAFLAAIASELAARLEEDTRAPAG